MWMVVDVDGECRWVVVVGDGQWWSGILNADGCGRGWMWTRMDVDADGCGRGWMWTRMDVEVAWLMTQHVQVCLDLEIFV